MSPSSEARRLEREQLRRLEVVSAVEACSLLLLVLVAAPLRHFAHQPWPAKVLGPVHGLIFLAYVWTVLQTVAGGGWSRAAVARLFLVAFVPFGGFLNFGLLQARLRELGEA